MGSSNQRRKVDRKKMYSFHLILAFVSATLAQDEMCTFNDNLLFEHQPSELSPDGAFEKTINPRNKWDDVGNIIPYYFKHSVIDPDRRNVQAQMKKIEDNTCIRFREMTDQKEINAANHSLMIEQFGNGMPCDSAWVEVGDSYGWKVPLRMLGERCDEGLMLHELGHVLGLMHTHKRHDRDEYLTVDTSCLNDQSQDTLDQYEKIPDHLSVTHDIPYKCNSIMHYFERSNSHCQVLTPKPGIHCEGGRVGRRPNGEPLQEDWDSINHQHCCSDGDSNCSFYAEQGDCNNEWRGWMMIYCKKTCNIC